MERTQIQPLPLILAREFASNVATPFAVVDSEGTLVFLNERAEAILGRTFAELGEVSEDEWRGLFRVERDDGTPVEAEETPASLARREGRPTQDTLVYTTLDGRRRRLHVTATPILGRNDEPVGVIVLFWEADEE